MAKNDDKITGVTPKGTFKFPKLNEPDTKFKKEGEYSVKLILSGEDKDKLEAKLSDAYDRAIADGEAAYKALAVPARKKLEAKGGFQANPLFTPLYDDNEEETGEFEFKFNMAASGEIKKGPKIGQRWQRAPQLFDAKGKVIDPATTPIGGGSVGRVSYEAYPYFIPSSGAAGLSLKISAVQVIELRQFGQKSANAFGFEEEEGFSAEEQARNDFTDADETSDTDAEDDGSRDF